MRFPTPTPLRAAAALAASAALAGCSFFTGIPDVSRVEVTVAPRVININARSVASGTAFDGNSVVRHAKRQVVFRSSNTAVATVNPTSGEILGLSQGVAVIFGEAGGKRGSDTVVVRLTPVRSVVFGQRTPRFRVGATNAISATPFDSANRVVGDRTVQYRSTNEAVLTIAANGIVTPRTVGTTQIIGFVDNGVGGGASAADTITAVVTLPPIASAQLTPLQANRVVGETQQYTLALTDSLGAAVTGRPVTWVSGNVGVATVSETGLATAVGPGSTSITAVLERVPGEPAQVSAQVGLVVSPVPAASVTATVASVTLRVGQSQAIPLTVRDAAGNELLGRSVFVSTPPDPAVADAGVSSSGLRSTGTITGRAVGTTTVSFQVLGPGNQPQGAAASVSVTVTP